MSESQYVIRKILIFYGDESTTYISKLPLHRQIKFNVVTRVWIITGCGMYMPKASGVKAGKLVMTKKIKKIKMDKDLSWKGGKKLKIQTESHIQKNEGNI